MRNCVLLLFVISSFHLFSQEYLGVNQSNYSGALGVDFNPANIADNRMKVDLFIGTSFTGHNNYLYMNTSNMPGGWISSFTGTQSADTAWRNQPWFDKIIGSDSTDYYRNLGQGNYFTTDPADLGNKPYRGIVNLNVDLFNLMVTLNRKSAIGLQVKHRTLVNVDHIAPELVTLAFNSLDYSSLWDLDLSDQLLNVSFNSWVEYNLSYAQVLKEDGEHFVKAGGKLKFLQGLGAAYINTDNVDYNFQDADFLPSVEELKRYKTKLELLENEDQNLNSSPKRHRAKFPDEYDSLGRNITEQERRQNKVPWVKVKYISGRLFIPEEKKSILRSMGLI